MPHQPYYNTSHSNNNNSAFSSRKGVLMEHDPRGELSALGVTLPAGTNFFQAGPFPGDAPPTMALPFAPSSSAYGGPPAMGWGGQAFNDNSSYRVPWFGRSHTKTPRTRKDDGKGRDGGGENNNSKAQNEDAISAEELLALIQKLPKKEPLPDRVFRALNHFDSRSAALLLKDISRLGMDKRAVELFEHIRSRDERGVRPLCDVYTFTAMVSMCIHQLNVDRAMELVEDMRQRGIEPNVHTYTALMNVAIKCGRLTLAVDIYSSMRTLNCMPNVVTYNALVDVYGKLGQWEKAVQVVDGMRKEGVEPVLRTYNTLIIACNMCNQPREALAVCSKLLSDGFTPNSTTYNALISAYGKVGQLNKALDIYHKMAHRNMERSVITYCSVISACEKAGQWETALKIFAEMQQDGCAPNTVTYNSLITACAQGSQWEKANEVFEQMNSQGCTPDVVTYTALISAFERGGQWQKALQAFSRMCKQGCKPDVIVFNAIIDTLWETGVAWAQRKALQLYGSAVQMGYFRRESVMSNATRVDLNLHAMTAGVAMLSLYTWLQEIQSAVSDLGPQALPSSLVIITDMGCSSSKEQGNCIVKEAVMAMMNFWQAPFRPVQSPQYAAALEANGAHVSEWVMNNSVQALLASLLPVSDTEAIGVEETMASYEQQVSRDCSSAFLAVRMFEQTHGLILDDMCDRYVQERSSLVSCLLDVGSKMGLRDEVVHDAVLLMDRVASEAKQVPDEMLPLMGLAAVAVTCKDIDKTSSDALSLQKLEMASEVPSAAIVNMEWNIRRLLRDDMSAVSTMRCLKLYLERLGLRCLNQQSIYGLAGYAIMMSVEALYELSLLNCRPSFVAAALVYAERRLRGSVPFWPSMLAKLTGYDDMHTPELLVAVRLAQKLARKNIYSQIYRTQMVALSSSGEALGMGFVSRAAAQSLSPTAPAAAPTQGFWDAGFDSGLKQVATAPRYLHTAGGFRVPAGSGMMGLAPGGHPNQQMLEQQHAMLSGHQALPSMDLLTQAMQTLAQREGLLIPPAAFPDSANLQARQPAINSSGAQEAADLPLSFARLGV